MKKNTTSILIISFLFIAVAYSVLPSQSKVSGSHSIFKVSTSATTGDLDFCAKCHPDIAGNISNISTPSNYKAHGEFTACICHGYYPNYTAIAGPYGGNINISINLKHNLTKAVYCTNCHTNYTAIGPNNGSVFLGNATNTAEEQSVDSNTVGLWHFNEGSGALANDSSPNGNNGTVTGAAWNSSGRFGNAISFDGGNDWVNADNNGSLDLQNLTFSAWVRLSQDESVSVDYQIIDKNLQYSWRFDFDSTNQLQLIVWDSVGTPSVRGSKSDWNVNEWYHIAVTVDGSSVQHYVNGMPDGPAGTIVPPVDGGSSQLLIGIASGLTNDFNGTIDEVHILNRTLDAGEISSFAGIAERWTANQSGHYIYINRSNTTKLYERAFRYFNRSPFGPL